MSTKAPLPIFVLTIEGGDKRRAPLLQRLKGMGLEYELFFGVDGRQGLPAVHEPLIDRSAQIETSGRAMTDGEYACTLSHLFIHRQIVARGLACAIVLEDDALIGTTFAALARGRIPVPGDLLMLDHAGGFYQWRRPVALGQGLHGYRVAIAPYLATGYVLTRQAAGFMLDHAFPVHGVADWPCDIRGLQSYAAHPRIVDHPDPRTGPSDLQSARLALRLDQRAKRPSGPKRLLTRAYWMRRKIDWYSARYRRLDAAVMLDLTQGGQDADSRQRT